MPDLRKFGNTSNIVRVRLRRSDTGQGLTGLASNANGLIISTICDKEANATSYTAAGNTIEAVANLGIYSAPTANKCRFSEVDSANHKGLYEMQFADARFAVANARELIISWTGAANMLDDAYQIQLVQFNPFDASVMGMTGVALDATVMKSANYTTPPTAIQNRQEMDANSTVLADIRNVSLGKWVLDSANNTLTLYKTDGVTVLKTFALTATTGTIPTYIGRT